MRKEIQRDQCPKQQFPSPGMSKIKRRFWTVKCSPDAHEKRNQRRDQNPNSLPCSGEAPQRHQKERQENVELFLHGERFCMWYRLHRGCSLKVTGFVIEKNVGEGECRGQQGFGKFVHLRGQEEPISKDGGNG